MHVQQCSYTLGPETLESTLIHYFRNVSLDIGYNSVKLHTERKKTVLTVKENPL